MLIFTGVQRVQAFSRPRLRDSNPHRVSVILPFSELWVTFFVSKLPEICGASAFSRHDVAYTRRVAMLPTRSLKYGIVP